MSDKWFYAKNSQTYGPFSKTDVSSMVRSGEISPKESMWQEGMFVWKTAEDVLDSAVESLPAPSQKPATDNNSGIAAWPASLTTAAVSTQKESTNQPTSQAVNRNTNSPKAQLICACTNCGTEYQSTFSVGQSAQCDNCNAIFIVGHFCGSHKEGFFSGFLSRKCPGCGANELVEKQSFLSEGERIYDKWVHIENTIYQCNSCKGVSVWWHAYKTPF